MALLTRVQLTVGTEQAPEYYVFETTPGLYVDDISTATGITSPNADGNFDDEVLSKIVELIRGGVLINIYVKLKPTQGTGKPVRKKMHVANTKFGTVAQGLVGKTWPIGKYQGYTITEIDTPARVVSRRY